MKNPTLFLRMEIERVYNQLNAHEALFSNSILMPYFIALVKILMKYRVASLLVPKYQAIKIQNHS